MKERLSVMQAAQLLGIAPETVRYLMEKGELPIGRVIKNQRRNTFLIYRELVNREIGK